MRRQGDGCIVGAVERYRGDEVREEQKRLKLLCCKEPSNSEGGTHFSMISGNSTAAYCFAMVTLQVRPTLCRCSQQRN